MGINIFSCSCWLNSCNTICKFQALEKYRYEQSLEHTGWFIEKLEKELEAYYEHVAQYKKGKEDAQPDSSVSHIFCLGKIKSKAMFACWIRGGIKLIWGEKNLIESKVMFGCQDYQIIWKFMELLISIFTWFK